MIGIRLIILMDILQGFFIAPGIIISVVVYNIFDQLIVTVEGNFSNNILQMPYLIYYVAKLYSTLLLMI